MKYTRLKWIIVGICCAALPALLLSQTAQSTKAAADWPMYNRDLASTRYSPLNQINTTNVTKLTQAWTFKPAAPAAANDGKGGGKGGAKGGGGGGLSGEVTPIVVNGIMYVPGGSRVFALEADTGKEIWTY